MSVVVLDDKTITAKIYYSVRDILLLHKNILPSLIHIKEKYFKQNNLIINTVSLYDKFSQLKNADEFQDALPGIKDMYPQLKEVEIVGLWLSHRDEGTANLPKFIRQMDPNLSSEENANRYLAQLEKSIDVQIKSLKKNIKDKDVLVAKLDELCEDIPTVLPFELTNVVFQMTIENDMDIVQFFDAISVSKRVPYVVYHGKVTLYKVFKEFSHLVEWVKESPIPGISTKIFSSTDKKMLSKKINPHSLYSDVHINNDCTTITTKLNKGNSDENSVKSAILNNIKVPLKVLDTRKISFKGSFVVSNINLNVALFAELVTNDPMFSYFLFLKENAKSFLSKKKRVFYFRVDKMIKDLPETEKNIIIFVSPLNQNSIIVKISKSQSYEDIVYFRYIFVRLLCAYEHKSAEIKKMYGAYLDKKEVNKFAIAKKSSKKQDKKTGKRLLDLKTKRPELFVSNYSKECQYKSGPRLVEDEDEIQQIKEENEHKIINFPLGSADWYTCEPRETPEEAPFVWPGLKRNTKLSNKDTFEHVPCCYVSNQYLKKNSDLNKYLSGASTSYEGSTKGHILRSDKCLPVNRLGYLPYNMAELAVSLGYKEIKRKKRTIFPILRYGVRKSPQSMIYCLEYATNANFDKLDDDLQVEMISEKRCELFQQDSMMCAQEYYELGCMNKKLKLKDVCKTDNFYIDPLKFVSLVSHFYNVDIFMFTISQYLDSKVDLKLPNYNTVYFREEESKDKCVILILQENFDTNYQYQCEILCSYNSEKKKFELNFLFDKKDPFVTKIKDMYKNYNHIKFIKNYRLIDL
ncbi:MAG TPA: hypothetical protein VLE02_02055 [Nitrosarchaeum sp.]|nr:hypothetical protein [Nitrosarchaeum sp.]